MKAFKSVVIITIFAFLGFGSGRCNLTSVSQPKSTVPIPDRQQKFISAVKTLDSAMSNAINEIQKKRAIERVRPTITDALDSSPIVVNWVGTVSYINDLGGFNVNLLGIDNYKFTNTCRGGIFDDCSAWVEVNSPLYEVIANLKVGDEVRFTGSLILKDDSLRIQYWQTSMPFDFSQIEKL